MSETSIAQRGPVSGASPAWAYAERLRQVATHLEMHGGTLSPVYVGRGEDLQVSTYPHLGEPDSVSAVLHWARSLDVERVWLRTAGGMAHVYVQGQALFGATFTVWGADYGGDLHRWAEQGQDTDITLAQLAAYVAAGTVDQAGEVLA